MGLHFSLQEQKQNNEYFLQIIEFFLEKRSREMKKENMNKIKKEVSEQQEGKIPWGIFFFSCYTSLFHFAFILLKRNIGGKILKNLIIYLKDIFILSRRSRRFACVEMMGNGTQDCEMKNLTY